MENENIQSILKKVDIPVVSSQDIEDIDKIVESEIERINNLIDEEKEDDAFASLLQLTSTINLSISQKPSLVRGLEKWINKIRSALKRLAKKVGANSFSITAGFPWGVSVSVSFPIT